MAVKSTSVFMQPIEVLLINIVTSCGVGGITGEIRKELNSMAA
jgi:hypothetical protein